MRVVLRHAFEYCCIVVILRYFIASIMLSLLINDFILYVAIVKHVVLIVVQALYKFPLLSLLLRQQLLVNGRLQPQ